MGQRDAAGGQKTGYAVVPWLAVHVGAIIIDGVESVKRLPGLPCLRPEIIIKQVFPRGRMNRRSPGDNSVEVKNRGIESAQFQYGLIRHVPALFTPRAEGTGHAAALEHARGLPGLRSVERALNLPQRGVQVCAGAVVAARR